MSKFAESIAAASCLQGDLLQHLKRYAKYMNDIRTGPYAEARKIVGNATHNSPILSYLGLAGGRSLRNALEDRLEDSTAYLSPEVESLIKLCICDIEDYEEGGRLLGEAEARYEFFVGQGKKAQDLFLLATIYCKKAEKVEPDQDLTSDFEAWLEKQTTIKLISENKEYTAMKDWVDKYKENRKTEQRREVLKGMRMERFAKKLAGTIGKKRIGDMNADLYVMGLSDFM